MVGSSGGWGVGGWGGEDMRDDSAEILFQSFYARGSREQFWHLQGCPLFGVVHPAFPLPTTASPTLQGALEDGSGEAVVACDMPEPCKFPSLDSCQKCSCGPTRKLIFSAPSLCPLLRVGDAEKFHQALGFENMHPFFFSQQAGSKFHSQRGGWK